MTVESRVVDQVASCGPTGVEAVAVDSPSRRETVLEARIIAAVPITVRVPGDDAPPDAR